MRYPSPAKVTELKKKLAPYFKDHLKRCCQPYYLSSGVHYQPGLSWSRDIKCDQKGKRMVLRIVWDQDDFHRVELRSFLTKVQQVVADVNATIEGNFIDCPYRLSLRKAELGSCDTTNDRMTILHGQVVGG